MLTCSALPAVPGGSGAPQRVDQTVRGDGLVGVQEEDGEQCPLLASELQRTAAV